MESHRTHRSKSSFVKRNRRAIGDFRDQKPRHTGRLGMNRVPGTRTRHAITYRDVIHTFSDTGHDAGAAVSQRRRPVETTAHCLYRREETIAPNFMDDLAHKVRPRLRFLQKALARKLRRRA